MSFILSWLEPTFNGLNPFNSLPFNYRWRLLLFQPIVFLINTLKYIPWLFSRRYTVIHISNRTGYPIRTLIFHPPTPPNPSPTRLPPLHVTLHGGGFIGGIPDSNASLSALLAARTGAIVVAPTYRFAPLHPFPAAANDIADVLAWLAHNARSALRADPSLLTVSGLSAGANLALSAAQTAPPGAVKASVTFYAPVDLRTPANLKPRPASFPTRDPAALILPLADAYCGRDGAARERNRGDARLHPILARLEDLPERMLFVVPTIDVILHEQLVFVERLKREIEERGEGRVVKSLIMEGQLHGWVELPDFAINTKTKDEAFNSAIEFIRETHRKYGFEWVG